MNSLMFFVNGKLKWQALPHTISLRFQPEHLWPRPHESRFVKSGRRSRGGVRATWHTHAPPRAPSSQNRREQPTRRVSRLRPAPRRGTYLPCRRCASASASNPPLPHSHPHPHQQAPRRVPAAPPPRAEQMSACVRGRGRGTRGLPPPPSRLCSVWTLGSRARPPHRRYTRTRARARTRALSRVPPFGPSTQPSRRRRRSSAWRRW